jgi:ABC-2 type transport system permease protein
MQPPYSQLKAAFALSKASLIATLRSPTSVVFALLFPIIFIVVFGSMVDTSEVSFKVGVTPHCDTANVLYHVVKDIPVINTVQGDSLSLLSDLKKGRIAAIFSITKDANSFNLPGYHLKLFTSSSSADKLPILQSAIQSALDNLNKKAFPENPEAFTFSTTLVPGRVYRKIDFILPGQLGFSLLMAGVFGSAFLLFSLRQTQVLKRIFATPIKRSYLILGEMLSRLFFQVITFSIIVALGYYAFHFTLINGIFTFLEMLLVSFLGLIIFTGTGFIISGMIKSESSIAPVANTITVPQILLCGLFFPIENYPHWLQSFCNLLPLTFYVDSLRKIAFEGLHFWQMPVELTGLLGWTIITILITVKVFKWE